MVDLLGPADAGAINTLTTTTDVTSPVAGDTWNQDCVGGVSGTGTPETAKYMNRLLQQIRAAIRGGGVPQSNAFDNMLSWAIQSGFANWIQANFAGSPNALTGAAPNGPQAIEGGTVVCGIVGAGLTNTGAATFNWSGLGLKPILTIDGQPLSGGEYVGGYFLVMRWDGGAWRIVSPPPLSWYANLFKIDVQTFLTSGSWSAPAGFAAGSRVIIEVWGAGAGGGSGSGGGGGAYERFETYLGDLPSSGAVVIGAGGAGTTTTDLVPATAGGASTFLYGWYNNVFSAAGGLPINNGTVNNGGAGVLFPAGTGGAGGQWYPDGAGVNGQSVNFGGGGGGGAQGTGAGNYTSAGTATFGGAGGAAPGGAGAQPGGGGGASDSTSVSGGLGGAGKVVVTVIQGG